MTRIPRYVYLGIGVIMRNVIKSARNIVIYNHQSGQCGVNHAIIMFLIMRICLNVFIVFIDL